MGICKGTLKAVSDSQLSQGYSKAFLKPMFGLSRMPDSGLKIATTAHEFDHLAPQYTKGASISGVQRKLLMDVVDNQLVPATHGQYIVKPAPPGLPHLPENEHAMMCLANAVGFNVAHCALLPFEDGEPGYVVKRFDILPSGQRLFIEDGASLCNVHPKHKGSDALSYEHALITLYEAAGKKLPVLLNGFRQVLFAYLIGNNDLHLKNFSMFRKPDVKSVTMVDFTPVYDVLSVFPYPDFQGDYLTLSLLESEVQGTFTPQYDAYGYYTQFDFIQLAKNIGMNDRAATTFVARLTNDVEKHLKHYIFASTMPEAMKQTLYTQITERIGCMRRPDV
ncbi:HipA domain-containing protein [Alteromonas antoniana]|uniref:HipA domain-containing protein n=1 Tax=Alteromonas antoniana TaxID=2803813 RepID=UPI001C485FC3|nr:HipA domain-containing protein [Alteromonas antoniana]